MTIGDKILNMRKARGWSQEELADRVGVTRQAVSRWEANSAKPDADKIVDISDLFGVSADYLLRDQYAGEGELPGSAQEQEAQVSRPAVTALQILGILMIISAILIFAALGIMSAIEPHTYTKNGVHFVGILGYIMGNKLWWLVNLIVVSLFGGIAFVIGSVPMKKLWNYAKEKLSRK